MKTLIRTILTGVIMLLSSTLSATTYVPIKMGSIIIIIPVDDPPVVQPDSATTPEDTPVLIDIRANDSDEDGVETTQITLIGQSDKGVGLVSAIAVENGQVRYQAPADWHGTDWFDYQLTDLNGNVSDTARVTVVVTPVNDSPVITFIDNQIIAEDGSITGLPFFLSDIDTSISAITVFAHSSNPALIPAANIRIHGSGANRTLDITPVANGYGSVLITVSASDGALTYERRFSVIITPINDLPVLSPVPAQSFDEDRMHTIAINVNDIDTPLNTLAFSFGSTNQTVLPVSGISLSGTGNRRILTLSPAAHASGNSTVTVSVMDGDAIPVTVSFAVQVIAVNDPPVISPVALQVMSEDSPGITVPLTVSDIDNSFAALSVTASSSNSTLFPANSLIVNKTHNQFSLTVIPRANQHGEADITLTASDGLLSYSETFRVTVTSVNDLPVLGAIVNQSFNEDTIHHVAISITDIDTPLNTLAFSFTSTDETVIPISGISITGTGTQRTLTLSPVAHASGSTTITVNVSDGAGTPITTSFVALVNPVNDAPVIAAISSQTLNEDSPGITVPLDVTDIDSHINTLSVQASADNSSLFPVGSLAVNNNNGTFSLDITPAANQHGTANITVSASDEDLSSATSFSVTVLSANDLPLISGTPATNIAAGQPYSFIPTATDVDDDILTFTIAGKPVWATFSNLTGALSGTPTYDQVGVYPDIVISVTDGIGGPVSLAPFNLTVSHTRRVVFIHTDLLGSPAAQSNENGGAQ